MRPNDSATLRKDFRFSPTVLPKGETPVLLSQSEAWQLVLRASQDQRKSEQNRIYPYAAVRLYLDGCRVARSLKTLLPQPGEQSFQQYARRIESSTGRKYSLVISQLQSLSWDLFDRAVPVIRRYFQLHGARRADIGLYVGNDHFSAFGPHVDVGFHGFQQILVGGDKLAWFWNDPDLTPEQISSLENTGEFEHLRDLAVVLEARTGESFSWPATARHVMENAGEHSVSLSLAFRSADAERVSSTVADAYRGMLESVLEDVKTSTGGELGCAHQIRRQLIEKLLQPADFERSLLALKLRSETSCGFEFTPIKKSSELRTSAIFAWKQSSTLRWQKNGSAVVFACCGHDFEVTSAPSWVESLLFQLTQSGPTTLAELCFSLQVSSAEQATAKSIVDALWSANGFELVNTGDS